MTTPRLTVGDAAPELTVLTTAGEMVNVSTHWKEGITLLTFLRHFGCLFCREWLSMLGKAEGEITAAGLQVVAIGLGEPKHAERYCGKLAPQATCLTDSTNGSHFSYGIGRATVGAFVNPALIRAGVRATGGKHFPGTPTGDVALLPATFLVDREGIIRYAYYSEHAGDHPVLADLLAAGAALRQPA